jgi:hypothetical protein
MLDLAEVKGDKFFDGIGAWMMHAIAFFHAECAVAEVDPCIHLETLMMTQEEFDKIRVGALLDELGLKH